MRSLNKRYVAIVLMLGLLFVGGVTSATPTLPCVVAGDETVTGDGNIDTYWRCDGTEWQPYKICEWQGECLYL